jgi:hypothetical protein
VFLSVTDISCARVLIYYCFSAGYKLISSLDSAVGTATHYRIDVRGAEVRVPEESRISSSPQCPDRLWGPSSLISNGYRG